MESSNLSFSLRAEHAAALQLGDEVAEPGQASPSAA